MNVLHGRQANSFILHFLLVQTRWAIETTDRTVSWVALISLKEWKTNVYCMILVDQCDKKNALKTSRGDGESRIIIISLDDWNFRLSIQLSISLSLSLLFHNFYLSLFISYAGESCNDLRNNGMIFLSNSALEMKRSFR